MAETIKLSAELRERAGKGAARQARREKKTPGVIYGDKKPPILISVDELELFRATRDPAYATQLYEVQAGKQKVTALIRDLQLDPVTDFPIHVDLMRVSAKTSVTMNVPVTFVNEDQCPGLEAGGVLNIVRHEVEVACKADSIPDQIEVDLSGFDVGDSIHISQITLPKGVEPTITDRDFTVASITAPSAMKSEGQDAEEAEDEGGDNNTDGGSSSDS